MKIRIILMVIGMIVSTSLFSQGFKGKVLLAPSLSFNSQSSKVKAGDSSTKGASNNHFSINLPIGGFLSDKFAMGGIIGYSDYTDKSVHYINGEPTDYKNQYGLLNLGFFMRFNAPVSEHINFIMDFSPVLGFGNGKSSGTSGTDKSKISMLMAGIYPGFNFRLSKSVYLEATIGSLSYSSTVTQDKDAKKEDPKYIDTSFGLNYNTVGLGVMILL